VIEPLEKMILATVPKTMAGAVIKARYLVEF